MLTHTYVTSTSCWIILEKLLPCFSLPCLQGAADQGKIASIAHGSSMLSVASDRYYMHRILVLRPDQKKINNGIPTFSLQNFTNSLLTQPHAMSPSDTQQMCCFYTSCVLFVHVCSVLSNYIYIYIYVCVWYVAIWAYMAQYGSILAQPWQYQHVINAFHHLTLSPSGAQVVEPRSKRIV